VSEGTGGSTSGANALNINTVPATRIKTAAATPANCTENGLSRLMLGWVAVISGITVITFLESQAALSFIRLSTIAILSSLITPIDLNKLPLFIFMINSFQM
jgi:hypothetical protein